MSSMAITPIAAINTMNGKRGVLTKLSFAVMG